ncbi:MAG: hypothetical protein J6Q85_08270 [Clostridia bacterium]|nr:hypothetical protein [Clostridia bacterium]
MTEKLYYIDAYIKEFTAAVLCSEPCDGGFDTVLDKTAFFPNEGGQSADTGKIKDATVLDVYEEGGVVHHITDRAVSGDMVHCKVDFAPRFDKMQCHTAEHILCGIIHRLYGLENVGFHIGEDEVTFDISAPLTREELDRVELLANRAVFDNLKVDTYFPTSDELPTLEYRSKLELTENVRIVKIGDVDSCACCAPHVAYTGEIGLIKILEIMKHRGGMRIWMVAGERALRDYRKKYENIKEISASLSVPQHDTADALKKYMSDTELAKREIKSLRKSLAEARAEAVAKTEGNAVFFFEGFSIEELRYFVNAAADKVSGMLVALGGEAGEYKYVITSNSVNLSAEIKRINEALSGRGGGKPNAVQGSFMAELAKIREYFGC